MFLENTNFEQIPADIPANTRKYLQILANTISANSKMLLENTLVCEGEKSLNKITILDHFLDQKWLQNGTKNY